MQYGSALCVFVFWFHTFVKMDFLLYSVDQTSVKINWKTQPRPVRHVSCNST